MNKSISTMNNSNNKHNKKQLRVVLQGTLNDADYVVTEEYSTLTDTQREYIEKLIQTLEAYPNWLYHIIYCPITQKEYTLDVDLLKRVFTHNSYTSGEGEYINSLKPYIQANGFKVP